MPFKNTVFYCSGTEKRKRVKDYVVLSNSQVRGFNKGRPKLSTE